MLMNLAIILDKGKTLRNFELFRHEEYGHFVYTNMG